MSEPDLPPPPGRRVRVKKRIRVRVRREDTPWRLIRRRLTKNRSILSSVLMWVAYILVGFLVAYYFLKGGLSTPPPVEQ